MGCNTHYRIPLVKGKENVKKYLKDEIEAQRKEDWWDEKCENQSEMRFYAIEQIDKNMSEELFEYANVGGRLYFVNGEPTILVCADKYDIDEPRIYGYPETIITSSDEMFEAMEKGLVGCEGKTHFFYWDENKDKMIRNNITEFFKQHPDGIINFG